MEGIIFGILRYISSEKMGGAFLLKMCSDS